jgi:ParB-like chromosome segregation protein Spo0J
VKNNTKQKSDKAARNAELAAGAVIIHKAEAEKAATETDNKPVKIGDMIVHSVATMFPTLPAKEIKELRESIAERGIEVPLLVNKKRDTIIDGRNRYLIAFELGLPREKIPMEVFKGKDEDIPEVVLRRNVFRRHLTPDQRVAAIAKLRIPQLKADAEKRKTAHQFGASAPNQSPSEAPVTVNSPAPGEVADILAKESEVSQHKGRQAVKAFKAGELGAVIEKKKTLKQAAAAAPAKKRKAKEQSLEDIVWVKWSRFLKSFSPQQRRQVKEIVRDFLVEDKADKEGGN